MTANSTGRTTRQGADIKRSLVFAGIIVLVAAGTRLAAAAGVLGAPSAGWSQRLTMATIGAFLMVTGNAIPKTLTPLGALSCDPAVVQSFQRLGGWTWALVGLVVAITWLVLPLSLAGTLTFVIVGTGLGSILVLYIRLQRNLALRRPLSKPLEETPCSRD